jgi:hypothetical protein
MGDFNFDLQNKNFRFSEFMEHTFSSKQIVSKVTRKYESLLDLAFLKVEYPTKTKNRNFVEDHPRNIPAKFGSNRPSGFGEEA